MRTYYILYGSDAALYNSSLKVVIILADIYLAHICDVYLNVVLHSMHRYCLAWDIFSPRVIMSFSRVT